MDYVCGHGSTRDNYSPNRLHMNLWVMLHCLCFLIALRTQDVRWRARKSRGHPRLHIILLSNLWPYLHILWPVMKVCFPGLHLYFFKVIAALNCCGHGGGNEEEGVQLIQHLSVKRFHVSLWCHPLDDIAALFNSICKYVWLDGMTIAQLCLGLPTI